MNLNYLNNNELVLNLKKFVLEERKLHIEILHHLREIEIRKIHLKSGYSNLFQYVTKELGYSEDAAYRRIQAMRLLKAVPEVEEKIQSGRLTLTTAAKIQNFFKLEERRAKQPQQNLQILNHVSDNNCLPESNESHSIKTTNAEPEKTFSSEVRLHTADYLHGQKGEQRTYTSHEQKLDLIKIFENKSSKQLDNELVKLNPKIKPKEKLRPLNSNEHELTLSIDSELKQNLDKLMNLLSHQNPSMSYVVLLKKLVSCGLEKWDPSLKSKNRVPAKTSPPLLYADSRTDSGTNSCANSLMNSAPKDLKINAVKAKASLKQRTVSGLPRSSMQKQSRHISRQIKQEVWVRSEGQCCYVDPITGRKCNSTSFLEIDHIVAFSKQGSNDIDNLQLLCKAHNVMKGAG